MQTFLKKYWRPKKAARFLGRSLDKTFADLEESLEDFVEERRDTDWATKASKQRAVDFAAWQLQNPTPKD